MGTMIRNGIEALSSIKPLRDKIAHVWPFLLDHVLSQVKTFYSKLFRNIYFVYVKFSWKKHAFTITIISN